MNLKTPILFILIISNNLLAGGMPSLSLISEASRINQNCEKSKCLSLEETIDLTKKNNFESRVDAIRVYQARESIQVRVGQLLPYFSLRISSPVDFFDFIPNLVGFLFPSNWFRLKESKLHAKASAQSFYSLMANQINSTESLYYNIHKEVVSYDIYTNHFNYVSKLKDIMALREEQGELAPEEVERAKIYLADLNINKISLENSFEELYAQLGYAINLSDSWNGYELKRLETPDINDLKPIKVETFYQQIIDKSYELRALQYLQKAAKYSKKARAFEFLTPDSGTESAFGFGYMSNINIGKADEEVVKIQTQMMNARLKEALYKVIANYNTSLQVYKEASNSIESISFIFESMMEDFEVNSRIDFEDFKDLLQENIYFQWAKSYSAHGYLLAKAQLDRLLLSGDFYENIEGLIPSKKGKIKCYQRKENRKIKKAIKNGELDEQKIDFSKEETKWCL